jgi:hypothetical protein
MAILSKGVNFSDGDQVTSGNLDNLVDNATFVAGGSGATDDTSLEVTGAGRLGIKDLGVSSGKIASSAVTTAKIASATGTSDGVTFAKIRQLENMKTIGNVSGSTAAPTQVSILDEDNMASDSATSLVTQQSVKAYVDNSKAGFNPTAYSGGESVTLPNGLIIKMGSVTATGNAATTVTFASAFPSGFVSGSATPSEDTNTDRNALKLANAGASSIQIRNTNGSNVTAYWIAYGH